LRVVAETIWQLAPHPSKPSSAKLGKPFDLSGGKAGEKQTFTLATDGHGSYAQSEVFQISGVHVEFECKDAEEGARGPDAPSDLYIKDVDSKVSLLIDGKELEKGKQVKLHTGAEIQFGDEGVFQIQRDSRAHA